RPPTGKPRFDLVREFNAFAAEMSARYPQRLLGLASTVPYEGDAFLKELERAICEDGLRGVMINTSTDGEYLDSHRADGFWELVRGREARVSLPPPRQTVGHDKMELFRLPEMVGRPFDTTLTLARLILTGVLERYPTLKLVCAHMGGAIALLPGR